VPGSLTAQALTTPGCLNLHRALAALGTPNAAVEVSSHALAQDRIAGLDFLIGAFTNLSRDHLDWHGTMDAYFEAKSRLFVRPGLRAAVINRDDAYADALLGRLGPDSRALTVAFGDPRATLRGTVLSSQLSGIALEIRTDSSVARLDSALMGAFNAENLLVALGVLVAADTPFEVAIDALSRSSSPPGRMEVFGGPPAPWVVVDFAHTPRALERVLAELGAMNAGAVSCVFGCGGERDRGKRMLMGQAAAQYAAHIVLTDDNPRGEDPVAIVSDIKAGIVRHPDLRVQHLRKRAIAEAIGSAASGDIVLVAGKGHESAQLIGDEARPFDDRAVVRRVLEAVS
jgi:UDP-N-acetylmuramoyl-L-alanyl-D-glutamate--2,6-diaminopimelate ligase